ncbi:MAG: rod shape-determining protein [Bdellovibrionaceae bacterium]|nr:rod shape-determining protein [Pseudobdellovibrionaceae bacterium]
MGFSDLYIDLGTANTLIYGKGKGFLLNEPSVFAIKNGRFENSVYGYGHLAKSMIGRTPHNVSVHRPLREGVIADFDTTLQMLKSFLAQIKFSSSWSRPRMIISLPCRVTEHERQAVIDVGMRMGARQVQLIDEPMAAAIGCGLDILSHQAHMVIDIGGGTTEIAVIASGGIVSAKAVRLGGDDITERIIHDLRQDFNFVVGHQTAEHIKHNVGLISPTASLVKVVQIGGFDLERGLPKRFDVSNLMIQKAVESVVERIVFTVKETLAELEPEVVVDLIERGIVLAGGGALISGLDRHLTQQLGIRTYVCKEPLLAVALGGARTLEDQELLSSIQLQAHSG